VKHLVRGSGRQYRLCAPKEVEWGGDRWVQGEMEHKHVGQGREVGMLSRRYAERRKGLKGEREQGHGARMTRVSLSLSRDCGSHHGNHKKKIVGTVKISDEE